MFEYQSCFLFSAEFSIGLFSNFELLLILKNTFIFTTDQFTVISMNC